MYFRSLCSQRRFAAATPPLLLPLRIFRLFGPAVVEDDVDEVASDKRVVTTR
jgi:hypothetical protein